MKDEAQARNRSNNNNLADNNNGNNDGEEHAEVVLCSVIEEGFDMIKMTDADGSISSGEMVSDDENKLDDEPKIHEYAMCTLDPPCDLEVIRQEWEHVDFAEDTGNETEDNEGATMTRNPFFTFHADNADSDSDDSAPGLIARPYDSSDDEDSVTTTSMPPSRTLFRSGRWLVARRPVSLSIRRSSLRL